MITGLPYQSPIFPQHHMTAKCWPAQKQASKSPNAPRKFNFSKTHVEGECIGGSQKMRSRDWDVIAVLRKLLVLDCITARSDAYVGIFSFRGRKWHWTKITALANVIYNLISRWPNQCHSRSERLFEDFTKIITFLFLSKDREMCTQDISIYSLSDVCLM